MFYHLREKFPTEGIKAVRPPDLQSELQLCLFAEDHLMEYYGAAGLLYWTLIMAECSLIHDYITWDELKTMFILWVEPSNLLAIF